MDVILSASKVDDDARSRITWTKISSEAPGRSIRGTLVENTYTYTHTHTHIHGFTFRFLRYVHDVR